MDSEWTNLKQTGVGCGRLMRMQGVSFTIKSGQLLAIVADGMGGHLAGEVASGLAVSIIKNIGKK